MHCDVKKFQYKGDQESAISLVNVRASIYGTTITFSFSSDKKEDILKSLSKAKTPLASVGACHISIETPLHDTNNIKKVWMSYPKTA